MKRTALARVTPLARTGALPPKRKDGQRRTRHPMPLPPIDGTPVTLHEDAGEAVAFGPQAQLCRETMCAACFAMECWSMRLPLRWERLPSNEGLSRTVPHHEPPMGRTVASDDDDTLPLCWGHHTGGGLVARHHHDDDPDAFYEAVNIPSWRAVRDEMRLRTKLKTLTLAAADGLVIADIEPTSEKP